MTRNSCQRTRRRSKSQFTRRSLAAGRFGNCVNIAIPEDWNRSSSSHKCRSTTNNEGEKRESGPNIVINRARIFKEMMRGLCGSYGNEMEDSSRPLSFSLSSHSQAPHHQRRHSRTPLKLPSGLLVFAFVFIARIEAEEWHSGGKKVTKPDEKFLSDPREDLRQNIGMFSL
jgi:hypothetical protein